MKRFSPVLPLLIFFLWFSPAALSVQTESAADPYSAYKYSGEGPRAIEDWTLARRRVETDPSWKKWVDTERQRLQRWQARGGDRAEWIAGYMHDYFDSTSMKEITWGEDTRPPQVGVPGSADAKRFGGWVYYFRMRNAEYVLLAAKLFRLTGDRQALDWARGQIGLYARQYSRWPVQTRAGSMTRLMSSSLDEAQMMVFLVPAVRLMQTEVAADEMKLWKAELLAPSARNLLDSYHGFNNISLWQRAAIGSIALLLNDPTLWREVVWGERSVAAILRAASTRDGFWNEGTFGYSEYVVLALLPFLHEAGTYGRGSEVEPIRRAAHDLLVAPLALRFPDGTLPNPGDNRGEPKAFKRYLFREAAYVLPTPIGVVEWLSTKAWPQLYVDWNPSQMAAVPLALRSHRFDETGFAMLRRTGWHLFLHFGQASANHAQFEALSFELHHDNARIVTDPGTTVYGSPLHEHFFRRAAAHNVPIVDDRGQERFALGMLVTFEPEHGRMAAIQPTYQSGVSVTRSFEIDAQKIVDLIDIRRERVTGKSVGAILQLDCDLRLPQTIDAPPVNLPAESGFGFWKQTKTFKLPPNFEIDAICGANSFRIRVEGPAAGTFLLGKPPILGSQDRSALYLRYPVSQGQIQTTYTLVGPESKSAAGGAASVTRQ